MFDAISRLFNPKVQKTEEVMDTKLAVAALLVHLIGVDGEVEEEERKTVRGVLQDQFDLSGADVETLIEKANQKDADAVDFYAFTSGIAKLEMDQRLDIIRMMWAVVFADKTMHEMEDNMVWRVAELIGVSTRDRTVLRSQMRQS